MTPINTLLLNGSPKATAIVRFDHSALLILSKGLKRIEFPSVKKMKEFIEEKGLEVNFEHIHPAGAKS